MSALIGKLRSIGNRDLSGALNERAFNFDDVSMTREGGGYCFVTQGVLGKLQDLQLWGRWPCGVVWERCDKSVLMERYVGDFWSCHSGSPHS